LGRIPHRRLALVHDPLQRRTRHRSLLARMQQPAQDLLAVELLPPSILLHHHVGNLVDALVRGKALVAALALAPPPDRVRLFALARIHHAVLRKTAVRTLHRPHFVEYKIETLNRTRFYQREAAHFWMTTRGETPASHDPSPAHHFIAVIEHCGLSRRNRPLRLI